MAILKDSPRSNRKINNSIDSLEKKMDSMYRDLYVTRTDNRDNLNTMINSIDSYIDDLQSSDEDIGSMTELIRRISGKSGNKSNDLINSVEDLFNDNAVIESLFANTEVHRFISAQNYQYDMLCKYIPKIQEALEIKRDNILSSDNFDKKFLNPKSPKSSKEEVVKFSANCKRIEKEYDIENFFEKTYMNMSKYGEDFIYVAPYSVALRRAAKRASKLKSAGYNRNNGLFESTNVLESNFTASKEFSEYLESVSLSKEELDSFDEKAFSNFSLNLGFNNTCVPNEVIEDTVTLNRAQWKKFKSIAESYDSRLSDELDNVEEAIESNPFNKDGLVISTSLDMNPDKIDKNIPGAVLERIKRENIIPVYIGKKCLGYYVFYFQEDKTACGFCGGHHITPGINDYVNMTKVDNQYQEELAIRYIANKLSANIDSRFINANKDLKEEIYAVLQYNNQFNINRTNNIDVTFIPAEDIIHCYFDIDEDTHRGISDLQKSVIPGMLYILLYITDIINKITRSTDKRIYYVKQNVETNVARTMMNVVKQIKKGNFGMRQIESMNSMLNIVGKYNDFIIPMGQSGDPPIQFEVMQGQDLQTPTDLMDQMLDQAVGPIVPLEFVNSTLQQDFAIRYSMSNTRFLNQVYKRQGICQRVFSRIYTPLYNYENQENFDWIQIILPPPIYSVMANNAQIFDNVTQMADKIVENNMQDYSDEVKSEFKNIYVRNNLGCYIDYDSIERSIQQAIVAVEVKKNPATEEESGMDEY